MPNDRQSLQEQLAPLRASRFANIPRVRPVMQMMLQSTSSSQDARTAAAKTVLDWANSKWEGLIPREAWQGEDFEDDRPGLKIAATSLPERGIWGFSVEHLDTDAGHSRNWITEAVIADLGGSNLLAVRNQCSSVQNERIPATTPRFVRQWVERQNLVDAGRPVVLTPQVIKTVEDVANLCTLLTLKERQLPVIVISGFADRSDFVIDANQLTRKTAALAHVYCLPAPLSHVLTKLVGRLNTVYNGAVRCYLPGYGQPEDRQIHANTLAQRIADWENETGKGPDAFVESLAAQLHAHSVNSPQKLEQHPGFATLRRQKAEIAWHARFAELESKRRELEGRAHKGRDDEIELLKLELEEQRAANEQAKKSIDEQRVRADEFQQLLETADEDIKAAREDIDGLRAQNANLFAALKQTKRDEASSAVPGTYEEIVPWIDETFADRVVLLQRAKRAMKDAKFENLQLVCDCVKLLANEYRELRTATPEEYASAKIKYENRMKELAVDDAQSIVPTRLGEVREQYTVNYTVGQSSRQVLDRHLRGGSSTKDDRYCLRIYFFWDDATSRVVIGHLPGHLDTRAS